MSAMKGDIGPVPDISPYRIHPSVRLGGGACKGVEILGHVISPATEGDQWRVLRD